MSWMSFLPTGWTSATPLKINKLGRVGAMHPPFRSLWASKINDTMIKAILFDLDDTLIEEHSLNEATLRVTCEFAGRQRGLDPEILHQGVRRHAGELWRASETIDYCRKIGISSREGLWGDFTGNDPELVTLQRWIPKYRQETWIRALAEQGVTDSDIAMRLAEYFVAERGGRQVVFPDTEPVLQDLKRTFRLALITNGAPGVQWAKINGSGLRHYFDEIIISGELGIGKPDPRIFTHSLEALGVTSDDAMMVGDTLERDIRGALQAGIRAIWINRFAQENQSEITPDEVIINLRGLPALLGGNS